MISMRENAVFRDGKPPNADKYFFRKGAIIVQMANKEIIYNKDDLISVQGSD